LLFRSIFVAAVCAVLCSSVFSAQRPQVTLTVTGGISGSIVIELYTDKAPVTCANFIKYVQSGFYTNLVFHRVIKNFMIQTGGFDQSLVYHTPTYPNIINESSNRLSNVRGTVAMARTSAADSASSQFFINDVNNTFLDYGYPVYDYRYTPPQIAGANVGYCVFGKVVTGMTVVDNISNVTTSTQGGMSDVPVTAIKIQSATITLQGPVCDTKLAGDVDGDCKVNFKDMAQLAGRWLQCNSLITQTCSQ
jgi:peptidyl-prolyl cis-trans isomerase A (cyclophilin A)